MTKGEVIKRPIDHIGGEIKKTAWSSAFGSLVILVLGILFIIWPNEMERFLAYIIGTFLIVRGGVQIIYYFMEKGQHDFFNNNLLAGVVAVLIGIAVLTIGDNIARVFGVIIGIIIIYESLVRINAATKLAAANVKAWQPLLVLGLVMLVVGVIVAFLTHGATIVVGWLMVLTGVIGIVGDVMFIKHVNTIIDKITTAAEKAGVNKKYQDAEEAEVKED